MLTIPSLSLAQVLVFLIILRNLVVDDTPEPQTLVKSVQRPGPLVR